MANQASWTGKLQIDGGQTLVLGGQLPLGVGSSPLGVESLSATLPKSADGKTASEQMVRVLPAAGSAYLIAIKADAYHDQGAATGALTLTLMKGDGKTAVGNPLPLSGDVLITRDVLAALGPDWVSINLSSTIKQDVCVQLLVVRAL
jgi:hypothetical protein